MKTVASTSECHMIYNGLIRGLLEYASPAFIGLSVGESKILQKIQRRCMKVIGANHNIVEDLDWRRRTLAVKLFKNLELQQTSIKDLVTPPLRSGRPAVVPCKSLLRQRSFFPFMSVLVSESCTEWAFFVMFCFLLYEFVCVLLVQLTFDFHYRYE